MTIISQAQEYRATIALLFAGTIAGFLAGRLSSVPNTSTLAPASEPTPESKEAPPPVIPTKEKGKEKEPESKLTDSDWEDEGQGELADFAGVNEECKLVLVVRTDLGMTKGAYCLYFLVCYKQPARGKSLGLHKDSCQESHTSQRSTKTLN
jgi:hypothetical protein